MTVQLGKCLLRVQPLLPLLWLASVIGGKGVETAGGMTALLLHECGHLSAARLLGARVTEIELSPIGSLITLEQPDTPSALKGLLLSAAGPVFSFGGCCLAHPLFQLGFGYSFCQALARSSLLLFLVNLLPALPLDGGRMARYLLSLFLPWQTATRLLTRLGQAAALLMCGLSVVFALRGQIVLSPLLAGMYLLYAASWEEKQAPGRYMTDLIARRQKLENWQALRVETLAVSAGMPVARLPSLLRNGRYHVIRILSEDGLRPVCEIGEEEIVDLIWAHPTETLSVCVKTAGRG